MKNNQNINLKKENVFKSIYNNIEQGICLHKVIYKNNKAVDYKIIETNLAFEKMLGISREKAIGSLGSKLYKTGKAPYLEKYVRVVKSGEPISFEDYFEPMDKYFHITVTSPEKGKFITLFNDISKTKKRKKQLNKQKEELSASKEQLEAYNEELVAMNEELEESFDELNELNNRFVNMIDLISNMEDKTLLDEKEFFSDLLENAVDIVPEADYGKICIINKEDECEFLDAVGHDIDKLKKLNIDKRKLFNYEKSGIYKSKDYFINLNQVSSKDKKILKEALKPIKDSLYININLSGEIVGRIALDIKENNVKEFSKTTKKIMESFSTLSSGFFAFKRFDNLKTNFTKELIGSVIKIMELYDLYTKGHSENVAKIASAIAEEMNLSKKIIQETYWAGLVHDIGKLLIPINILNKKGKLSDEEFALIKKHPLWGYKALVNSSSLKQIAKYILHHHEKWNGSGYPEGISGNDIPLISQILSISDAWDAMLSKRSYRDSLSRKEAIKEIEKNKGSQFSPKIVDVFVNMIREKKIGNLINSISEDEIESIKPDELKLDKNESFENLFEQSDLGIVILDSNYKIIRANKHFKKMFRFKQKNLQGMDIKEIVPKDKFSETKKYMRKLKETGRVNSRTYRETKDGKIIEVDIKAFPTLLKEGNIGYYVIYQDISELKKKEKQYKDVKGRYKALFQNKDTVMLIIDPETADIVDVNPAAVDFYGWSKDQLTTMKISDINILDNYKVENKLKKAVTETKINFEFKHKIASGKIKNVEVYSQPINFGEKNYLYSIIHDITKKKKQKKELIEKKELVQNTLDSLSANIVILDDNGLIKYTNQAWKIFAKNNGASLDNVGIGNNYLKIIENSDCEGMNQLYSEINKVMKKEKDIHTMKYPCHSPTEKRWFKMKVTPFKGKGPYSVVIAHENITEKNT